VDLRSLTEVVVEEEQIILQVERVVPEAQAAVATAVVPWGVVSTKIQLVVQAALAEVEADKAHWVVAVLPEHLEALGLSSSATQPQRRPTIHAEVL
jgi:hypothetical protein